MEQPNSSDNESTVPFVSEESSTLGEIRINHSVVANIVRIATLSVPGVHSVGGGRFEGITEMFAKREGERGVRVSEDEGGTYEIDIRVILDFGVELARTGGQIQQTVREEVSKMTSKDVARVDITIDGVHVPEEPKQESGQWTG
ncbi:Asp23/Gls24 family envelope stress response protein [Puniceicoccus vermicola]|uniref:Asp23/Gls24 family envelope stress response protein n=1 Tax=Puniceicoccus vermicola TaxID=388746 RepID=A0A7X1AV97_9BACT|nr:Asp23/Gls24 family envelope stress response protein [Puniceicoccus vermicola]MBC2600656.1 Asp23/Gls24 family envelope stress response protein [Puniceicoccus vermicola]